jgi:hypothetical protein
MHCDRTRNPNHHSALSTDGNPDDDPRSTKPRGIRINAAIKVLKYRLNEIAITILPWWFCEIAVYEERPGS